MFPKPTTLAVVALGLISTNPALSFVLLPIGPLLPDFPVEIVVPDLEPPPPAAEQLKVDVSATDEAIVYGDILPVDAIHKLLESCSQVGCSGAKGVETITGVVDSKGYLQERKIVISAEGSFNRDKKATREAMVEIVKVVAREMTTSQEVGYLYPCGSPFCPVVSTVQYSFSQSLHMSVLEDGADDAHLNLFIKLESTLQPGFCGKLLGAGAAVGSAISGVVGGVFGLGALLCQG